MRHLLFNIPPQLFFELTGRKVHESVGGPEGFDYQLFTAQCLDRKEIWAGLDVQAGLNGATTTLTLFDSQEAAIKRRHLDCLFSLKVRPAISNIIEECLTIGGYVPIVTFPQETPTSINALRFCRDFAYQTYFTAIQLVKDAEGNYMQGVLLSESKA